MRSRSLFQSSLRCCSTILCGETITHRSCIASSKLRLACLKRNGRGFSSAPVHVAWNEGTKQTPIKHCSTCTCGEKETSRPIRYPCGSLQHEDDHGILPLPLSEPSYSAHKRVLPSSLTALSSAQGRRHLLDAFANNTAESYWALTEHFVNQSDPAFCGVTTLLMVLNSMCVDPQIRWRGGWRFYGSEDVLLDRCCLSSERIRRVGVTMEEFCTLGRCHGLTIELKRPLGDDDDDDENFILEEFRQDIRRVLTDTESRPILVVSFSRQHLGQTGEGHFSPIAAYHEPTDQVLLLDVARFKYAPYWVSVRDLYKSMEPNDSVTQKSRGWLLLRPPKNYACATHTHEDRRPAELVPQVGEVDACPVGKVKIDFCRANPDRR